MSPRPGNLGLFPGGSAEMAPPAKGLQVVPKKREPRSERAPAQWGDSE